MPHSNQNKIIGVVIAEDDAILLMDAMDLAEEAGLKPYGAHNAEQAIKLLEENADVGVLFTDVQMGGSMDGVALAHWARKRQPDLAIIVTSGVAMITSGELPDDGRFIPKPYAPKVIIRTLSELAQKFAT
jgi:CheY-like chemotaxis protein